jgi:organic hydroperoxide reductase OsmC/OhrA
MAVTSKVFRYAASLHADGTMHADGVGAVRLPDEWTPDHMVLAAATWCSINSLRHHAGRLGIAVTGEGDARAVVTRREDDGRFAITAIDIDLVVRLDPVPAPEAARELLRMAERDCFVGASLRAQPRYRWTVEGAGVAASQRVEPAV